MPKVRYYTEQQEAGISKGEGVILQSRVQHRGNASKESLGIVEMTAPINKLQLVIT